MLAWHRQREVGRLSDRKDHAYGSGLPVAAADVTELDGEVIHRVLNPLILQVPSRYEYRFDG